MEGKLFKNLTEDDKMQIEYYKDFQSHINDLIKDNYDEDTVKFTIYANSLLKTIDDFNEIAMQDFGMAFFAVLFVFIYLNIHMRSFCLSCTGISLIMLSFPITIFITNVVLQVKYFGQL